MVQFGQCICWIQIDLQEGGDQGDRLHPKAGLGHAVSHFAHAEHCRERGKQRGRHPGRRVHGRAHGFDPLDELVRHPKLAEPAGVGKPLLRGLWFGRDVRTGRRAIHNLPLMDAQDGVQVLLTQERQMDKGAERPIPHEHVPRAQRRMERRDLGHVVGVPRGRTHLQQEARPGMKQGEQVSHGEPTPRALPTRLAEVFLQCRRIGHRKTRPIDQERAVPSPPSLVVGHVFADRGRPTQQLLPDHKRQPGAGLAIG